VAVRVERRRLVAGLRLIMRSSVSACADAFTPPLSAASRFPVTARPRRRNRHVLLRGRSDAIEDLELISGAARPRSGLRDACVARSCRLGSGNDEKTDPALRRAFRIGVVRNRRPENDDVDRESDSQRAARKSLALPEPQKEPQHLVIVVHSGPLKWLRAYRASPISPAACSLHRPLSSLGRAGSGRP
jgi:hypothetical protein